MINSIHVLQLQSVGNIRDLGGFQAGNGKQLKYGKIFRSAHLHHLSETDQITLQALGVNKVIDFRGVEEQENEPDKPTSTSHSARLPSRLARPVVPVVRQECTKCSSHPLIKNPSVPAVHTSMSINLQKRLRPA